MPDLNDILKIEKHRDAWILVSLIILFAGVDAAILVNKWSRMLGLAVAAAGGTLLYISVNVGRERTEAGPHILPVPEQIEGPTLAETAVRLYTLNGRFPLMMPITGAALIVLVFFYNLYSGFNTYLGSNDYVVLLLAASILTYNYIPDKYSVERDFGLVFLSLLMLVVVIPTTYYEFKYGTTGGSWDDRNPNSPFIHYLLGIPLVNILNLLGITSKLNGVTISFLSASHRRLTISIALGCTGLYSVSIFLSAFISYIVVEYRKFDRKAAVLMTLGIITAYVANLIRMTIIILVGYRYGMDALLWTHKNIGELIFMFWIGIFWGLMFKYLDINLPGLSEKAGPSEEITGEKTPETAGTSTSEGVQDILSASESGGAEGSGSHDHD